MKFSTRQVRYFALGTAIFYLSTLPYISAKAQCKELIDRRNGEVTKYVRMHVKGAAEQIIVSNTAHRFKLAYENKLNNDPRFRVKRGDTIAITASNRTVYKIITESFNVARGYNIAADLTQKDLSELGGITEIKFPSTMGQQIIRIKKGKSKRLAKAIICLNQ